MNIKLLDDMVIGEPYSNFNIEIDGKVLKLRRFSDGTEEYYEIFNDISGDWDYEISEEFFRANRIVILRINKFYWY